METSKNIAKHLREVYFGGNWSCSNLKDQLSEVSWKQATTKLHSCNTIASLVAHMTYYVREVTKVLGGKPLTAKDKFSFQHPPINSAEDWDNMLEAIYSEAKDFANLIEQLPNDKHELVFTDPKYGTYYRNLHGIIEHLHYHLGQIVILKKIFSGENQNEMHD